MPRSLPKRERTAFHEAGHVVVANRFRIPVRKVTIAPDGNALGDTQFAPFNEMCDSRTAKKVTRRQWLERYTILALAGTASEICRLEEHKEVSDSNREAFRNRWLPKLWKENSDDNKYAEDYIRNILEIHPFTDPQTLCEAEEYRERSIYRSLLWEWTCRLMAFWTTWQNVEAVARKLLEAETISGRQAKRLLRPSPNSRRDRGFL